MDVRKVVSHRTTSASGHKLPIERSVLGIVTLGNIEIKQRFLVVQQDMAVDVILGMNFVTKLDGMRFDMQKMFGYLKKGSGTYRFSLVEQVDPEKLCYKVAAQQTVMLPPFSIKGVPAKMQKPAEEEYYCVEPLNQKFPKANFVAQLWADGTEIMCANRTESTQIIPEGSHIAVAYVLEEGRTRKRKVAERVCEIRDGQPLDLIRFWNSPYQEVIQQYEDIISTDDYDIGRTALVQHEIPLLDPTPVKQRAYRCPERLKDELKQQVDEMLEHGIVKPSSSPWASPVLLVKKKNGKYRLCIDYRKLNAQTRKDSYPLPRISDMLEKFKGAKVFSSLDLMKGYYQVEMKKKDREKTAFITEDGLYEYQIMPFILTGAH